LLDIAGSPKALGDYQGVESRLFTPVKTVILQAHCMKPFACQNCQPQAVNVSVKQQKPS
jgi:hypothetical protein